LQRKTPWMKTAQAAGEDDGTTADSAFGGMTSVGITTSGGTVIDTDASGARAIGGGQV
jgi:hypothetical protein